MSEETVGISKVMDLGEEGTEPPRSNAQPWGQESSQEKGAPFASARKLASNVPVTPLSPGIKRGGGRTHRGPLPCPLPWLSLGPQDTRRGAQLTGAPDCGSRAWRAPDPGSPRCRALPSTLLP